MISIRKIFKGPKVIAICTIILTVLFIIAVFAP